MSDNGETTVNSYAYDAFGRVVNRTEGVASPYGFTGRVLDNESGLMNYRARYYEPGVGRFITADPIGFLAGINFYTYCLNDPVNQIDPLGLFDWGFGGIIGPLNVNWNSSNPHTSNLDIVTDLEIGGGLTFCFDITKDECGRPRDLPVDFNAGTGKYTGITINGNKLCINIGLSIGFLGIDVSKRVGTH